jgi:hypothetical protein
MKKFILNILAQIALSLALSKGKKAEVKISRRL